MKQTELKRRIEIILVELRQDSRTAYKVLKATRDEMIRLETENARLLTIEKAFNSFLGEG